MRGSSGNGGVGVDSGCIAVGGDYEPVKHDERNSSDEAADESKINEILDIHYEQGHIQIKKWGDHEKKRGWIVFRGILVTLSVNFLLFVSIGGLVQVSREYYEMAAQNSTEQSSLLS